ncbi:4Fe-4S binding protein, partial [Candidatus Bipolaricaulota bacterium]
PYYQKAREKGVIFVRFEESLEFDTGQHIGEEAVSVFVLPPGIDFLRSGRHDDRPDVQFEAEGKVSEIREDRCSGCGACVEVCAYRAIELDEVKGKAVVNEALCKGCGACAATCRAAAIDLKGFRNEMILSALAAL